MKLKTKIITYVSLVLIILVLAIAYVVFGLIQPTRLEKLMESTMVKVAGSVVHEFAVDLQTNDNRRFSRLSRNLLILEDVYGIAIYDTTGQLRFSSHFMTNLPSKLDEESHQQIFEEQQHWFQRELFFNTEILTLFYPIAEGNEVIGALQLMFTFDSLRQYRWESMSASLLACGIGLIVLIVLVYSLLSNLFSRIQAVIKKMNTIIEERDLTQRVVVESRDEIGELGDVFNKMAERLLHLTREIQRTGLRVTTSTDQIVEVARSHLEAAEDLMLSIEEAKGGVEDLKKLADQISGKSETVLSNAEYTLKKTVRGVEVVEELVTEMNEIDETTRAGFQQITALNEKAQQITEIVTIIEDITANTKLIAFNATIEAARAGESGKGFSVVANEIRSLADSVVEATSNIRKIIQDMQEASSRSTETEAKEREKVEHGILIVKRTKEHLDMVLRMLDDTVNHARDISFATEEQKLSNSRIVEKMQKFFEIALFTKSSSANTSASARELDRLAEELQATVEQFKLE
jgi:methyl-accepting chemotaxis protein